MTINEWMNLILEEAVQHKALLKEAIWTHLWISGSAWGIAVFFGLLLGYASCRSRLLSNTVIPFFNTVRVIPGLALIAFLIPLLGTGILPTVVALCVIALPAVLLNTRAGFQQIDPLMVEGARGLGLDNRQVFQRVELPLAMPFILTGLRIAGVEIIAGATLAAFIGGGGLGTLIVNGLSTYNFPLLLTGAIPVALLALIVELGFNASIRMANRYQEC